MEVDTKCGPTHVAEVFFRIDLAGEVQDPALTQRPFFFLERN